MSKHQELAKDYQKIAEKIKKTYFRTLCFQVPIVIIVCVMKGFQSTVSSTQNLIAVWVVAALVCWRFFYFVSERNLDEQMAEAMIEGDKIERNNSSPPLPFFKSHLKNFSVWGEVGIRMILTFFILYFFSVVFTQWVKSAHPEWMSSLKATYRLRDIIINGAFLWGYYYPFRALIKYQREVENTEQVA